MTKTNQIKSQAFGCGCFGAEDEAENQYANKNVMSENSDFANLLANQKDVDADIARITSEQFWELYEPFLDD